MWCLVPWDGTGLPRQSVTYLALPQSQVNANLVYSRGSGNSIQPVQSSVWLSRCEMKRTHSAVSGSFAQFAMPVTVVIGGSLGHPVTLQKNGVCV
tara:strand:- start:151 stop:435 length:285 start_codon:yes stop_codon:yes gene_type:complete